MKEVYLQLTAFITGSLVMILEILGFRMFAPYFGYSVYVSGMLIGIILIALALGSYAGGVLVDKYPDFHLLSKILLGADVYLFLVAFTYDSLLRWLSHLSVMTGTFWASVLLFAPPMFLLGIVSPFLVKLIAEAHTVGLTVGKVTAVGTIGSIVGTFLATFYLIPVVGTHRSLYITAIVLLLLTVGALVTAQKRYGVFLLLLFLFNPQPVQSEGNIVYQSESPYNLIKVVDHGDKLYLKLNQAGWIQSVKSKQDMMTGYYYDYLNIAPMLTKGRNILILGMAAGTSALQFRDFFDNTAIDGVEIDPQVVDVSHTYFNIPRDDPRLHIYADDARPFLWKSVKKYDVVEIDMYQGGFSIPFYTATAEFFQLVYDHLDDEGVLVMNIADPTVTDGRELVLNPIGVTAHAVFPSIFILPAGGNTILLATKQTMSKQTLDQKLDLYLPGPLASLAAYGKDHLQEFNEPGMILTDDLAPIEQLTYKAMKR